MDFVLLPQFPLQIVVYPNEKLDLHIFEPRYRQLIVEAIAKESTFSIPTHILMLRNYYSEVTLHPLCSNICLERG